MLPDKVKCYEVTTSYTFYVLAEEQPDQWDVADIMAEREDPPEILHVKELNLRDEANLKRLERWRGIMWGDANPDELTAPELAAMVRDALAKEKREREIQEEVDRVQVKFNFDT